MCRSTVDRAQRHRGERDLQAALVPGVADRHAVALLQGGRSCAGWPPPAAAGRWRWRASGSAGPVPSISTALSICSIVDMPVERMTGLPVSRSARSRSRSVTEAEATLWVSDAGLLQELDRGHVPRARRTSAGRGRRRTRSRSRSYWSCRTRPGTGSPGRSSRPTGWSASCRRMSAGAEISGVRFWNLTAFAPASAATSISCLAISMSPLWLMPISPIT